MIIDCLRSTLCLRRDMLWDYKSKSENLLKISEDFVRDCLYPSYNSALDHLREYLEKDNEKNATKI